MKKNIISLSLLLLTAQCIMGATKNEILQILVSSHNGAFGKDNLYKEPIAADDLRRWESAMSEAKKFVIANGSTLRVLDVDFIKALSTVEAANKDLINFIRD